MKNWERDGIWMPPPHPPMRDRELAVLRALGRLGPTRMQDLAHLLLIGMSRAAAYRLMARLRDGGWVWETRGPSVGQQRADGRPGPPRSERVFGLTVEGRNQLDVMGGEPVGAVLERLIVRDRRGPPPAQLALQSDVLLSAWCAAVLEQARRAPMLVGARCQVKLVPALDPGTGQVLQTMGAYVELRFEGQRRSHERPRWQVPWQEEPAPAGSQVVRWGLEVDTGSQVVQRLVLQAKTYAALQPVYAKVLGGPVTPILLTPAGQRAGQVMQAWREGWPETTAVIASYERAEHPTLGVLWGTYSTVRDSPPKPTYLLGRLVPDPKTWVQMTAGWAERPRE
ncbi:winged helix-turn-helix transcriptional regulator [Chloroflexia bacterium SDU3-3]|nr:winged helix-turn-helix transcriptional regulator [Chloroflexia bacterium SDU3-3]